MLATVHQRSSGTFQGDISYKDLLPDADFVALRRLTSDEAKSNEELHDLWETVDGSEIRRSPVDMESLSHYSTFFFPSQVVQAFFHQQYLLSHVCFV